MVELMKQQKAEIENMKTIFYGFNYKIADLLQIIVVNFSSKDQ